MKHQPESKSVIEGQLLYNEIVNLIALLKDNSRFIYMPQERRLWTTTDVANYLGITYKYASEWIVTHHTFPDALRIPTKNGKRGHPRWYASEVMDWVAEQKE